MKYQGLKIIIIIIIIIIIVPNNCETNTTIRISMNVSTNKCKKKLSFYNNV